MQPAAREGEHDLQSDPRVWSIEVLLGSHKALSQRFQLNQKDAVVPGSSVLDKGTVEPRYVDR